MTRHCHRCGWEWTAPGQPGRTERCDRCEADLRVCLNCVSYDPHAAHQCRDRNAEPVPDKDGGNFCEFFGFARRSFNPAAASPDRGDAARAQWRKLFGGD